MADRTDTPAAKAEEDKVRAAHEAGEPKGRAVDRRGDDQITRDTEDANLAEKKVDAEVKAVEAGERMPDAGDPRHMRQLPPSDVAEALTPEEKARLAELRAKAPSAHAKERTDDEEAEYRRLMDREHENPPPDVVGA